ncbi:Lipopolysaccharide export system ATP-binding protein LptB [subsurface metagenome]
MAILEVKNLSKNFGGLKAVSDVNLDIHDGEILGLIGPNGSGKTTIYNLITGFLKPTAGQVLYKGESITGLKPHKIAAKGMARTFQLPSFFPNLTVKENVIVGRHLEAKDDIQWSILNTRNYRGEKARLEQEAMGILTFMGLEQEADVFAKNLPYGHMRNLEIAIALALSPKLLLLDEPATGMNPEENI